MSEGTQKVGGLCLRGHGHTGHPEARRGTQPCTRGLAWALTPAVFTPEVFSPILEVLLARGERAVLIEALPEDLAWALAEIERITRETPRLLGPHAGDLDKFLVLAWLDLGLRPLAILTSNPDLLPPSWRARLPHVALCEKPERFLMKRRTTMLNPPATKEATNA